MKVCVFMGSQAGNNNNYLQSSIKLARLLAKNSFSLVYGGANVGLMGIVADTVLAEGGKVIGIITNDLKNIAHQQLTEIYIVESMQDRKKGWLIYLMHLLCYLED